MLLPVTIACMMSAASLQALPPQVMFGLYKTEGGHVGQWTTNTNGSHDLGPLQINDETWLRKIADLQFGGDTQLALTALLDDGCYNVNVGAWIFRQYLNEAGGDYAAAIGYYNSHSPAPAAIYRQRFLHSLEELGFYDPKTPNGQSTEAPKAP